MKTSFLTIRLSDDQKAVLRELSEASKVTMTEYIVRKLRLDRRVLK